jgi:hypothetical protein
LFAGMPRSDQRHALSVLRTVRAARLPPDGETERALWQAALLHDCAKQWGGIRLYHRVAVVLLHAIAAPLAARWAAGPEPAPASWRRPLCAHARHPEQGAQLAASAGCDTLAVLLIRHHQDRLPSSCGDALVDRLLPLLQAADGDN